MIILLCFFFSIKNKCCGYSLEEPYRRASIEYQQHMFLPHRGASNEYIQHMFLWRTGENYPIIMLSAKNFTLSAKGITDNYNANSRHQWMSPARSRVYEIVLNCLYAVNKAIYVPALNAPLSS